MTTQKKMMWIIGPQNQDDVDRSLIPSKYSLCTDPCRLIEMISKASEQHRCIGVMECSSIGEFDRIRNNGGFTTINYTACILPSFAPPLSVQEPQKVVKKPKIITTTDKKPHPILDTIIAVKTKSDPDNLFFQDVDEAIEVWRENLITTLDQVKADEAVLNKNHKAHYSCGIWWDTTTRQEDHDSDDKLEHIQRNRIPCAYFYQNESHIKLRRVETDFLRPYQDNRRSFFMKHDPEEFGPNERCLLALHALTMELLENFNNIVEMDEKNGTTYRKTKKLLAVIYVPELLPCFQEDYEPTSSVTALLYYRYRFLLSFYMQHHCVTWKFVVQTALTAPTHYFTRTIHGYLLKKSLLSSGSPSSLFYKTSTLTPSAYLYYSSSPTLMHLSVYDHPSHYRWLLRYMSVTPKCDHLDVELSMIRSSSHYTSEFTTVFCGVEENNIKDHRKQSVTMKISSYPLTFQSISIKSQVVAAKEYYYQDKSSVMADYMVFTRESIKSDLDKDSIKLRMIHQIMNFSLSSFLFMSRQTLCIDLQKKNRSSSSSSEAITVADNNNQSLLRHLFPLNNEIMTKSAAASAEKFIHLCRDTISDRRAWLNKWMYSKTWTERVLCNDLFTVWSMLNKK